MAEHEYELHGMGAMVPPRVERTGVNFDGRPPLPAPEMVHLFTLDDVDYMVPARPRPHVGLRYLWETRTHGETYATAGLMNAMLGPEGFEALSTYENMTEEDLKRIMAIVRDLAMGSVERPNGS